MSYPSVLGPCKSPGCPSDAYSDGLCAIHALKHAEETIAAMTRALADAEASDAGSRKTRTKKAKKRRPLNKAERKILVELLELAVDEFSNHGCNDYELKRTPENEALWLAVESWADPDETSTLPPVGETIMTTDWLLMSYMIKRLEGRL
jgi:hypothetical protein